MKTRKMSFKRNVDSNAYLGAGYYWLYKWISPYIKNKKILDVGCWTGVLENLLIKLECHVTGIDIVEEPLVEARKKFPKYSFLKASIADSLPFNKKKFDIVFFFMTIEHLPRGTEIKALRNINNVMKKNGKLFLTTMNNNFLSNLFDPLYFFGHRHYNSKDLENILKKAGFKINELRINGGFVMIIYTFLFYFYKHLLHRTFFSRTIDDWMKNEYDRSGFAEIKIIAEKIKNIK